MSQLAEDAIVAATAAILAWRLCAAGWFAEAGTIALLVVGACAVQALAHQRGQRSPCGPVGYRCRSGASWGLALGCSTPGLVVCALSLARAQSDLRLGPLRAYMWAASACGAHTLLSFAAARARGASRARLVSLLVTCTLLGVLSPALLLGRRAALLCVVALAVSSALFNGALCVVEQCFTPGEASTLAQTGALLFADVLVLTRCERADPDLLREPAHTMCTPRDEALSVAEVGLCGALLLATGLAILMQSVPLHLTPHRRAAVFYSASAGGAAALFSRLARVLGGRSPLVWLLRLCSARGGALLIALWAIAVPLGSLAAARLVEAVADPSRQVARRRLTLARKAYHLLVLLVALPALPHHRGLLCLALAVAMALFALVEVVRANRVPPLAAHVDRFMRRFVDARDGRALLLTHQYLLAGCAAPLLLCSSIDLDPSSHARAPLARAAAPLAGLIAVGIGDAVASAVGAHCGRLCWPGTTKTVEGSAAAATAMLAALSLLRRISGIADSEREGAGWVVACTCAVCLLEATTSQIDNLYLPLLYLTALLLLVQ